MTEGQLGRLLPACLHEAIADVLPQRLEFYEEWLHPDDLRDGRIGVAPISAVVGFLRTEGPGYDAVMARAGALAAEWTMASMPLLQRRVGGALPRPLRAHFALRVARRIIRGIFSATVASTRLRRGSARVRVAPSLFCAVRERHVSPLCGFYAALVRETLRGFQIDASVRIESCVATGGTSCVVAVELIGTGVNVDPARAA
jgi:hypothetical protein